MTGSDGASQLWERGWAFGPVLCMIRQALWESLVMLMRRTLVLGTVSLVLASGMAVAGGAHQINATGGVAIRGYDPVAYFTEGKAVQGKPEFSIMWKGAMWRFDSSENLALFEGNPRRYAPQYGGYCAVGMAEGKLIAAEPRSFAIHDGKLYLNSSSAALADWTAHIDRYIAEADRNWPALMKK